MMVERKFQRVAVLMGGPGAEREVSLRTGAAIAGALREAGYDVEELDIIDLQFTLPDGCEAVYVAVHGSMGEDGTLQAELERRRVPYTGSRSYEMTRSFDKEISKALLDTAKLPHAAWRMVYPDAPVHGQCFPCVAKAPRQGSSIGVEIIEHAAAWEGALQRVSAFADRILIESFVPGRECTVSFLGSEPLPVVEICPAEGRYDYEAKYQRQDTDYLCPAPFSDAVTARLHTLARQAYEVLGGRHVGRIDFIVPAQGDPVILELNTIPGCTATSLLPKAAAAAGIAFSTLCASIMEMAEV